MALCELVLSRTPHVQIECIPWSLLTTSRILGPGVQSDQPPPRLFGAEMQAQVFSSMGEWVGSLGTRTLTTS